MTRFSFAKLRRFRDSEDGSMVVPFALWAPVLIGVVLSTIELGAVTIRHTALERALDETVRDVRLGTGSIFDHDDLKLSICQRAAILPSCLDTLRLEMVKLNMRDWQAPIASADCVDVAEPLKPLRAFEYGADNEVMMLRACFKYTPISPAGYMSSSLATDAEGYTAIVATSAFVQEPS